MTRSDFAPLGRPLRGLLLGTAFASLAASGALAETLTVTDIAPTDASGYGLSVPTIEVVDGNLNEGTVRGLFTGTPDALQPLSTLNAASVTIPEISVSYKIDVEGAEPAVITYRDLVLTDVVDGVAASATVASSEFKGGEAGIAKFGEMSASNFDLGRLLGFYGLVPTDGTDTELREVYSDFTFSGGTFAVDGVFNCDIGGAEVASFSARPLKQSMGDIQGLILEAEAAEKAGTPIEPEQIKQIVLFYTDLLTAFSSSPMTFDGIDCSGKDDAGKPLAFSTGTITAGGFEPAIYPDFSLDDLKIEVEGDGHVNFGNFTWKRMDFTTAIEIVEAATTLDEAFFTANWRRLVPAMDGFSLANLDFDVPDPDKPGERVKGTLGSFDATLGNYVNGIPGDVALTLANFILPITADMKDLPVQDLLDRGIDTLDISLGTKLAWNEEASTIEVEDVLIDMGALGRVNFSGTFGNATEALFADNPDEALIAAQMMTLKALTIEVEDRGIGSIAFAAGAKEAGQPEEAFRTAVAGMAQGMTLAFLGNTTEALTAAQQLGTFLQGASHLKVTITSKDEAGIGLADLAAAETNPAALAGKLDVVAEASGEPVVLPLVEAPPSMQDQKRDLKTPATTQ